MFSYALISRPEKPKLQEKYYSIALIEVDDKKNSRMLKQGYRGICKNKYTQIMDYCLNFDQNKQYKLFSF
jgi:hypothetical protein